MTKVTTRQATPEDAQFAFAVKKMALGPYVVASYGWDEGEQLALHARRFNPAETRIILADGEPAGLVTVRQEPDCIHLWQLFILPQFQGRGIGTRIAGDILAEADSERVPVALQVLKTNPRARAFYERLGFEIAGETGTHHQLRRNIDPESRRSLSFDPMVESYDASRTFDAACFSAAVSYLADRFPPDRYRCLFEPGIGTGRIAIPLAEQGYEVTGVDISNGMLDVLRKRLAECQRPLPVSFQQGDVQSLSFADKQFDIAVVVHLFYFIAGWRKAVDELLRVVRPDGPIILMHTGMGMEVPALNDRYKAICAEHGCVIKPVGVASTREVIEYLSGLGCSVESIADRWKWVSRIRLDAAISFLRNRAYSFTSVASDRVHSLAVERLESELNEAHGPLKAEVEVPNQVQMVVVRRGGHAAS